MSRTTFADPCEKCGKRPYLRLETNGSGKHAEVLIEGCEHERKKRGVCKLCPKPVRGVPGKSEFCTPCYEERRRVHARESHKRQYDRDPEKYREKSRRFRQARPEVVAAQRKRGRKRKVLQQKIDRWKGAEWYTRALAKRRERYSSDPAYRDEVRAKQAAYRARKRAERAAPPEKQPRAA